MEKVKYYLKLVWDFLKGLSNYAQAVLFILISFFVLKYFRDSSISFSAVLQEAKQRFGVDLGLLAQERGRISQEKEKIDSELEELKNKRDRETNIIDELEHEKQNQKDYTNTDDLDAALDRHGI